MGNEMNMKTWLESYAYERQKEVVKRANHRPFYIDYSVFKKDSAEKLKLIKLKMSLPKTRTHKFKTVMHEQF